MLTIESVLAYTRAYNPKLFGNARRVTISKLAVTSEVDDDGDEFRKVVGICQGETIPRRIEYHFYGTRNKNGYIWVTCTCEYWLYHCEVATSKKGSAEIIHSNGANPKITNPRNMPALCKHLLKGLMDGVSTLIPKEAAKKIGQKGRSKAEPLTKEKPKPFVKKK